MILPETDVQSALQVAERARLVTEQTGTDVAGKAIHVTASFGVAGFDADAQDHQLSDQKMIERADEALYQAKETGRNRVCVYSG